LHAESVCRLGEHYFTKSRVYSDSISAHSGEANNPKVKDWMSARDKAYDTASIWLKKGFGLKTDDVVVASQYALISSLLGRFDEAALGFKRLAELEPNTLDNWVSLGDTYVRTSSFKDAIEAYEKAEAISDANINMLETMQSIYRELGDAKNADRITAKLAKRK
jgi:tetratricopeptide (TPR) repeat protein